MGTHIVKERQRTRSALGGVTLRGELKSSCGGRLISGRRENVGLVSGKDMISRFNHYRRTIARYRVRLEIDAGLAAFPCDRWKATDTSLGVMDGLIEQLEVEIEGASLAVHPRAGLALEALQIIQRARWVFEKAYREQGLASHGGSVPEASHFHHSLLAKALSELVGF